ncbi:28S ribosomal protein S31, mitochondrial-like [Choloepus didactylus]|uniref:28S ribosomal protein S31, mitochondrial-like n=1 Tax=Choloepus didactylus TaxID=27675 RepID=UPI0018A0E51F|nr:28S ribosomal protein S31, mitochondrial-like [Choloepus didactylus]
MFVGAGALRALRPRSLRALSSGSREATAEGVLLLAARRRTARTKNNIQRYFGTNSVICSKKDEQQSVPTNELSKGMSKNQDNVKENMKKDLLTIIKGMKVELSKVNVQTTKPPNRRPLKSLEATVGRLQKPTENTTSKRNESLSPELVAAASAVAESLPFDKQMTKSELLRQLRQHEEKWRAQKDEERRKVSFSNIISDMKVAKSAIARINRRPEHQIQFDEGPENFVDEEKTADLRKSFKKNIFKGKRLNIFDIKAITEEIPEAETSPSLWDVEFAKQLASVNQQPFQNGFEEMIQWTKEGKLWEFPVNNEAGFNDDGSEFHEHIFLDKYLEDFPKQGPIRHFMELVTCGLSKNPYLNVKQKVEHIEWFRNYFKEKRDILKENDIQFN